VDTNKKTATIVGVLYIIGTVAGILSVVFYGSVLNTPDYLIKVSANESQIIIGAFFVLLMGLALALVPVMMFPIAKKHNEVLALGYVVFRGALETITYIAMAISQLLLIPLSQEFVKAGAPDTSYFQTLGVLLRQAHDSMDPILAIVFCLGALMFYSLLYQSKLIPRWLSGWGLIAAVLWLIAGLLALFGLIDPMSSIRNVFALPIGVQEMVMAIWLIVKGFNSSAIALASVSAQANANEVQMSPSR
jgi:hypothetical protein